MDNYAVILFFSNNYAIWTSRVLKKEGVIYKMIPVPRQLSSDCGYCVRIQNKDKPAIMSLLTAKGIEFDRIEEL